jgi:hypothetical protein
MYIPPQASTEKLISVSPVAPSPRRSGHRRNVSDTAALKLPGPNRHSAFRWATHAQ